MGVLSKNTLIFILVIAFLIVPFVSATDFERHTLNYYFGGSADDTYNLRSVSTNGVDYNDLTSCSVGFGTDLGVYPVQFQYGSNYYNYLVVPTSSSIRIINSNCTEINTISPSSVLFHGTLSTIVESDNTHKYVILGYNYSSNETGFYSFTFNPSSELLEFEEYKRIGSDIDTDKFNGVACGWEQESLSDGGCGIVHYNTLVYWDIGSDTLTNYTTTYNMNRLRSDWLPYGSVVDFDNDNNNEMVFTTYVEDLSFGQGDFIYLTFDMVNKVFDREKSIDHYSKMSLVIYDMYTSDEIIFGTPCQIGGYSSEMEMCYNFYYRSNTAPTTRGGQYIIKYDDSMYGTHSEGNRIFQTPATDVNGDLNKDFVLFAYAGVGITEVIVKDHTYINSLWEWNFSTLNIGNGAIHTLLFDIDDDGNEELLLNNGEVYELNGGSVSYSLPYLSNSSKGYLIAGDLNHDFENEIIYADTDNIYIYSTNPTEDYISEPIPIPYAYDTDGGKVYNVSGTAYNGTDLTGNDTILDDVCLNSVTLLERYINGTGVYTEVYDCGTLYDACSNGVCFTGVPPTTTTTTTTTTSTTTTTLQINSTKYCWDSDGDNIMSIGVINTDLGRFNDICVNDLVREHICNGLGGAYYETTCPSGFYCENGRCRGDSYLNFSSTLVDTENPADAISEDARGLLPDVYFGTIEFFRNSFKPVFALFLIVMIALMIWAVASKVNQK